MKYVSPLRYSGGKSWFLRHIIEYLGGSRPSLFIEPFAGGAGTTLTILINGLVDKDLLVERNRHVAAFWREAIETDDLIGKVASFEVTRESVLDVVAHPERDPAFWTFVKSHCSFGGNLTGGLMKDVGSRWNTKRLVGILKQIRALSSRLKIIEEDALEVLEQYASEPDAFAFVDPLISRPAKTFTRIGN